MAWSRSPSASNCPVYQEPFGAQAGFPQDHPLFAGHLPARRARLRDVLEPHDTVLVVGTGAIRQYPYDTGPLVNPPTRLALVTQDPEEAHRSPVEVAVLGRARRRLRRARRGRRRASRRRRAPLSPARPATAARRR